MASGKKSKAQPKNGGNSKSAPPERKIPIFGIVIVGILVLGVVVLVLARSKSRPESFNIDAQVNVAGAPLPAFPADKSPDTAIGMPAPSVTGTTLDGQPITIGPDGKPKVIIFIAHWCPHCQKEVPIVQKWVDQNGMPPGMDLVAVATGNNEGKPNYPPNNWLKREAWTIPTMIDSRNEQTARAFGLSGYPFWAIVDAQGRVVGRQSGEITSEELPQLFAMALQTAPAANIADPNLSSQAPG